MPKAEQQPPLIVALFYADNDTLQRDVLKFVWIDRAASVLVAAPAAVLMTIQDYIQQDAGFDHARITYRPILPTITSAEVGDLVQDFSAHHLDQASLLTVIAGLDYADDRYNILSASKSAAQHTILQAYDQLRSEPDQLSAMLRKYPRVLMNGSVIANPFYQPDLPSAALWNWQLDTLAANGTRSGEVGDPAFSHLALAQINEVVVAVDNDWRVTYWNAAAERLYNLPAQAALGQHLPAIFQVTYSSPNEYQQAVETVRRQGLWRGEVLHRLRDGSDLPVFVSVSAIAGSDGQSVGYLAIIYDLAKTKQLQQQLQQSDQILKLLTNNMRDLVALHDAKGRFRYISPSFEFQLGYTPDLLLGQSIDALCHPADATLIPQALSTLTRHRANEVTLTVRLRHLEVGYIWYEMSARLVESQEPDFQVVSSWHDVSQRVASEGELRERNEAMRGMAHRLSEIEDFERKRISQTLHDGVGQNLSLVNINLSNLSAILEDQGVSKASPIIRQIDSLLSEVSSFVRGAMDDLHSNVLDEWGIAEALQTHASRLHGQTKLKIEVITTELARRPPPPIERGIYRIAQEALINIVKHAYASHATIMLKNTVGGIQMVVEDDGVGFDVNKPKAINARSGMGLDNMRERALAMNGRLTITSTSGKGTRLSVIIPVSEELR